MILLKKMTEYKLIFQENKEKIQNPLLTTPMPFLGRRIKKVLIEDYYETRSAQIVFS